MIRSGAPRSVETHKAHDGARAQRRVGGEEVN
jgi:hypothetical protein